MYRQKKLRKMAKQEAKRCRKLYSKMYKQLAYLPKGSLSLRKGELCRAVRENGRQYLVPLRGDTQLYASLKNRRYIKKGLPLLKQKIEALELFLSTDVIYDPKEIEKILPLQYKGTAGLTVFLDDDIDIETWINTPYKRNPAPFKETHFTKGYVKMRSKSEAMIGSSLEDYGIIYKPELGIKIGGKIIYPDFVILLPKQRIVIIWEHFGKVDDKNYIYDKLRRLMEYGREGFYLGVNLFITYEMAGQPLTIKEIEKTIHEILAVDNEI